MAAILAVPGLGAHPRSPSRMVVTEAEKLVASDGQNNDYFGYAVAVSGDAAIVGAFHDYDLGPLSGSAYVFELDGEGKWAEVGKLLASDGSSYDEFGSSVAISGDTLVVGAPRDDPLGYESGAAYVFERDEAGAWSEVVKLLPADGSVADEFGYSVAVSGDTLVAGALFEGNRGAVYVFERDGTRAWSETQKLVASDREASDHFGESVGVSGSTVAVGAPWKGDFLGAAYVFEREDGVWSEVAKLLASDGTDDDRFGTAVAVSPRAVVVGAYGDDDAGEDSGSAYAFEPDEARGWTEVAKLLASDGEADDRLGISVAISGDTALVGADWHDGQGDNAGAAYVFSLLAAGAAGSGLCLDAVGSCNDYFLSATPLAPTLWRVSGYEYGCGEATRLVAGTMRRAGPSLHLGLTGSNDAPSGSGQLHHRNYVIDRVTGSGSYEYLYTYLAGGALRSSQGGGTVGLRTCADPGLSRAEGGRSDELRSAAAAPPARGEDTTRRGDPR